MSDETLPWKVCIDGVWYEPHSAAAEAARLKIARRTLNLREQQDKHPGPRVWVGRDGPTTRDTKSVPAFYITPQDETDDE